MRHKAPHACPPPSPPLPAISLAALLGEAKHERTVFAANSAMYRNLSRRLAALSRSTAAAIAAAVSAFASPLPPPTTTPTPAEPRLEPPRTFPTPPALTAQDPPAGRHEPILPLLAVRCSRKARGDIGGDAIVARRMMGSSPTRRSRLGGERRTREERWSDSALRALPRPPLAGPIDDNAAVPSSPRRC